MKNKKPYRHPPTPVYVIGKRKERCSKAIALVQLLLADSPGNCGLRSALDTLKHHREKLNEI